MTFGSLFAGIGGFDLGLERAGMTCAWQVEREPYAVRVLEKHWPNVRRHDDVCTFPPAEGRWEVDLICGGFPCQDISYAGKGAGLAGERSGLWHEMHRIISQLRPRYVIVENVAALLTRGMGTVLGDLAEIGYDSEWHVIPAAAVGAPHRRDRVWIVADAGRQHCTQGGGCNRPNAESCRERNYNRSRSESDDRRQFKATENEALADAQSFRDSQQYEPHSGTDSTRQSRAKLTDQCGTALGNADCLLLERDGQAGQQESRSRREEWQPQRTGCDFCEWWITEPDVGRVAHGVPSRVDRLRGLGNAVVPQVVELIGRAIVQQEARQEAGWARRQEHPRRMDS